MKGKDYVINRMTRKEVDLAVDWAAEEGWNPGLFDGDAFYAADPQGFFIGKVKGEPVSVISVIKYGDHFAFLGFYIVKKEFRGKGYGYEIWKEGLKSAEGRVVGLDGVVEQQGNYRKSGFRLAYRNVRYRGTTGGISVNNEKIVSLDEISFKRIAEYDDAFFPEQRRVFLRQWLKQPRSVALGMVNKNKLMGYGMIRKCREGYKIGPLFAEKPESAEELFLNLIGEVEGGCPVFLDVPQVNADGVKMAEKYGMEIVFETARMYKGEIPSSPVNKTFGVTTFELG